MFGSVKCNAVDAAGILGVTYAGTRLAAASPGLRYTLKRGDKPIDHPAADVRFLGGIGAAIAAYFTKGNIRRAARDVAVGSFASLVTTESLRHASGHAAHSPDVAALPEDAASKGYAAWEELSEAYDY